MAQQKFTIADLKGLTPAIDPTQIEEPFILGGRNFFFNAKGPKSGFANRLLTPQARNLPAYSQGIKLRLLTGDVTLQIDGQGIWAWDEESGGYLNIYRTDDTTVAPNRWTWGFIADLVYLCHPVVGILVYDPDTGVCQPHSEVGIATPESAIAIAVNNGRLGVATDITTAWASASNGLDFTPALGGAGFQLITDRVSGRPITISSYPGGFLTWTTGGVLRSEFTGDSTVYRHRALESDYRPANSFCIAKISDDTSLILDERGLFQCKGDNITPFAPLFNEYLIDYVRENGLKIGENMRIDWDDLRRLLFVSISETRYDPLYEKTFVLYAPLDKWGSFDEPHYGILPIQIDGSEREGNYAGFVDREGRTRYWLDKGNREIPPRQAALGDCNLHYPALQMAVQFSDEGFIGASVGKANAVTKAGFLGAAGFYLADATAKAPAKVQGLDAAIRIGLFRPLGPSSPDQLSEIINVLVRNVPSAPSGGYPIGSDSADYEEGKFDFQGHKLTILSSNDGLSTFMTVDPNLVSESTLARHYSCSTVGIWHTIEIRAEDLDEIFHLRTLEITATNAGRLL